MMWYAAECALCPDVDAHAHARIISIMARTNAIPYDAARRAPRAATQVGAPIIQQELGPEMPANLV